MKPTLFSAIVSSFLLINVSFAGNTNSQAGVGLVELNGFQAFSSTAPLAGIGSLGPIVLTAFICETLKQEDDMTNALTLDLSQELDLPVMPIILGNQGVVIHHTQQTFQRDKKQYKKHRRNNPFKKVPKHTKRPKGTFYKRPHR